MTEMIEMLDVKIRQQVKQFLRELDTLGIAYKVLESHVMSSVRSRNYRVGPV